MERNFLRCWHGRCLPCDWNTIFVEVPLSTFNPVKTVNDLVRPQHQEHKEGWFLYSWKMLWAETLWQYGGWRLKHVYHELASVDRKKENWCKLIKFCHSSLFLFLFYRISENSSGSFLPIHTIKPAAFTYIPFTSWSKWRDARIGIPSFSANTVPDSNVSPPRRSRISSQIRSCLLPDSVVSRPAFDINVRDWNEIAIAGFCSLLLKTIWVMAFQKKAVRW